jgi:hypothetical protein
VQNQAGCNCGKRTDPRFNDELFHHGCINLVNLYYKCQ